MSCYIPVADLTDSLKAAYKHDFAKYRDLSAVIESVMSLDLEPEAKIHAIWFYAGYVNSAALKESRLQTEEWKRGVYQNIHNYLEPYITGKDTFDYEELSKKIIEFFPDKTIEPEELTLEDQIRNAINELAVIPDESVDIEAAKTLKLITDNRAIIDEVVLDPQNTLVRSYLLQLRNVLAARLVQPITTIVKVDNAIKDNDSYYSQAVDYINMREQPGIGIHNGRPMYVLRRKDGQVYEVYYDDTVQNKYRYYSPGTILHDSVVMLQPGDQVFQFYDKKNDAKVSPKDSRVIRIQPEELVTGLSLGQRTNVDDEDRVSVHQRIADTTPSDKGFYAVIKINANKNMQALHQKRRMRILSNFPNIRRTIETSERPNQVQHLETRSEPILSIARTTDDFTVTVTNHDNTLSFDLEVFSNYALVYPDNSVEMIDVERPDHLEILRNQVEIKKGDGYQKLNDDDIKQFVDAVRRYNEFKAEVLAQMEAVGSDNIDIRGIFYKYYDLTNSLTKVELSDKNINDQPLSEHIDSMNGRLPVKIQKYDDKGNKIGEPEIIKLPIVLRKTRDVWMVENTLPENAKLVDENGKEYNSIDIYSNSVLKDAEGNPLSLTEYVKSTPFHTARQALYVAFEVNPRNPTALKPIFKPLVYQQEATSNEDLINLFVTMVQAFNNASMVEGNTTVADWNNKFWGFNVNKQGIKPDVVLMSVSGQKKKFGIKYVMISDPTKNTPEQVEAFNKYFGAKERILPIYPELVDNINKIVSDLFESANMSLPATASLQEAALMARQLSKIVGDKNPAVSRLRSALNDLTNSIKNSNENLLQTYHSDIANGKVPEVMNETSEKYAIFDGNVLKLYSRGLKQNPLASYYTLKTTDEKKLTLTYRNPLKPVIIPGLVKPRPSIQMGPVAVPVSGEIINDPGTLAEPPAVPGGIIPLSNDPFKLVQALESFITLSPEEFDKEIETIKRLLPTAFKFTTEGFEGLDVDGDALGYLRGLFIHLNNTLRGKGVAFHEAFHGVFRNILSLNDQKYYLKRAERVLGDYKSDDKGKYITVNDKKVYANEFRQQRRYLHLNDEQIKYLIYEEYMADAFADFMDSGKAPQTWLEKLFAYLRMFINFFKKNKEIENLFYDISLGKFRTATVTERPSNVDTVYSIKDYKGLPSIVSNPYNQDQIARNYQVVESAIVQEVADRLVAEMAALKVTHPSLKEADLFDIARVNVLKEYQLSSLIEQAPTRAADITNAYSKHYDTAQWLLGEFHLSQRGFKFLNYTSKSEYDGLVVDRGSYPDILAESQKTHESFKKSVIKDYKNVVVDEVDVDQELLNATENEEKSEEELGENFRETSFISAAPGEGSAEFRKMFKYVTYEYIDPRFGIRRKRTVNSRAIFNTIRKITTNLDKLDVVPRILEEINHLNDIIDDYNINIRTEIGADYVIPKSYSDLLTLRDSLQAVYDTLTKAVGLEEGYPSKNLHVFIQFVNTFSTIDAKLMQVQLATTLETPEDKTKPEVVEQTYKLSDIVIGTDLNNIRQDIKGSIYRFNLSPEKAKEQLDVLSELGSIFDDVAKMQDLFIANGKLNDAELKKYINRIYIAIAKLNLDIPYTVVDTLFAYQVYRKFNEIYFDTYGTTLKADDFFAPSSSYRVILRNNKDYFNQFSNLEYKFWSNTIKSAIDARLAVPAGSGTTEQLEKQLSRLSEGYIKSAGEFILKYDPNLAASVTRNANGDMVVKYVKPTPAYVALMKLQRNADISTGLQEFIEDYFPGFQGYFADNPMFDLSKEENRLFLENLSVSAFGGFSQTIKIDNKTPVKNDPTTFNGIDDKTYALAMFGMFVNRTQRLVPNQKEKLITYKRIVTQYEATSTSIVIDAKYKRYVDAAGNPTKQNDRVAFVDDLLSVVKQEYNLIKKNFQEERTNSAPKIYKDYNDSTGARRGFTFNILRDFFVVGDTSVQENAVDNKSQRIGLRSNLIEEASKNTSWEELLANNPDLLSLLEQQLNLFGREQLQIFRDKLTQLGITEQDYPISDLYLNASRNMVADMFFNNWINGMQVNQLFDGAIAVGIKNFADFFKRQKAGAAAGENIYNPFRSSLGRTKTYRAAVMQEIIFYIDDNDLTKPAKLTPYNGPGEKNKAVKIFDGQSVNTIERRIKIAESQGQVDYDALEILKKMRYMLDSSPEYSKDIIALRNRNIYFNSLKTVAAAGFQYIKQSEHTLLRRDVSVIRTDINKNVAQQRLKNLYENADIYAEFLDLGITTMLEDPKTGEMRPVEDLYKETMSEIHSYFVPMKGREALHVILNSMEMDRIEQLMDPNASKKATVKPVSVDYQSIESGEGYLDLQSALENVPTDLTYIQVETGGITTKVTQGIQQKLLIMAQLNPNDPQYAAIKKDIQGYRDNLSAAVKSEVTRIQRMLDTNNTDVIGKIYTAIADGLREQGADPTILQWFELNPDGTPKYSPANPLITNTIVYYYFSLFNNGIFNKKIAGDKFYHVSPYGYKILETSRGDIITHREYKKNPDLYKNVNARYPSLRREEYDETDPVTGITEKKVRYIAEAIIPAKLKELDQTFVERYLSEFFSTRIPTEDKRSMIVVKVVDYIDEAYGNSIIVPFQLHMLSGSDFDIDSLYAHMKSSYKAPDGTRDGTRVLYGNYAHYKSKYKMTENDAKFIEYLIYMSKDDMVKPFLSEEIRKIDEQSSYKAEQARIFGDTFGGQIKDFFYENAALLEKEETEDNAELIDDFKKLIATFNVLQIFKESNLPTSPASLQSYIRTTGTNPVVNVILNDIVQNKINILSNPKVFDRFLQATNNRADAATEIYEDLVRRRGMTETEIYTKQNLYTPTALIVARSINAESKDSLGIAASFNKGVSMLNTIMATLKKPVGTVYINDGKTKINTDKIVDDAVQLVGGAIGLFADAPKNPYPGPLHLTDTTTPVMLGMFSLGFPHAGAIMFQSIPVIKQVLDRYIQQYGSSYRTTSGFAISKKNFLSGIIADAIEQNTKYLEENGILDYHPTTGEPIINKDSYKLIWNGVDTIKPDTEDQLATGLIPLENFGFSITDKNGASFPGDVENLLILNEFLNYMEYANYVSFSITKLTDTLKALRPDQDVFDRLLNTFKELKENPNDSKYLSGTSIANLWKAYPVLNAAYDALKYMDAMSKKVLIERTSFMKGLSALFANVRGLDADLIKKNLKAFIMLQLQNEMMQADPKGILPQLYLEQLDAEKFLDGTTISDYYYLRGKYPNNAFLQAVNAVTDNNGKRVLELTAKGNNATLFTDFLALLTDDIDVKARAFRIAYHGMIKSGAQRAKGSYYHLIPAALSKPMSDAMFALQDQLVSLDEYMLANHKLVKNEAGFYEMTPLAKQEYADRLNEILSKKFGNRKMDEIITDAVSKIVAYNIINSAEGVKRNTTSLWRVNKQLGNANLESAAIEELVSLIKQVAPGYSDNIITDQGNRKELGLPVAFDNVGLDQVDLFVPTGNTLELKIPGLDRRSKEILKTMGIYSWGDDYAFPLYRYNVYGQMMVLKKIDNKSLGEAFVETLAETAFSGSSNKINLIGRSAVYEVVQKQGTGKISPLAFDNRQGAILNNIVKGLQQTSSVRADAIPNWLNINRLQNKAYYFWPLANTQKGPVITNKTYSAIDNSTVTIGQVDGKYQFYNGKLYMTNKAGASATAQTPEQTALFAQALGAPSLEDLQNNPVFTDFFKGSAYIYLYNLNNGDINSPTAQPPAAPITPQTPVSTTQPSTQSAKRKTYSGKVTSLQPNQIFVFGSNEGSSKGGKPTHGAGSAKLAKDKFGAIQGQSRGIQGQSYAIVTKKFYDVEKSSTPGEIIKEIQGLYDYANKNTNKEFLVSDYSESNLNGYTGQEMADMFVKAGPIPSNIVFNDNFDKLITTQPSTQPTGVKGFQGYKGGFEDKGKGTPQGDGKDKAMRQVADGAIVEFKTDKVDSSSFTTLNYFDGTYSYEKDRYIGEAFTGDSFMGYRNKVIMLARNGKFAGISLNDETKRSIKRAFDRGVEFVVGDMPGVDSQFIDYLQEIGAKFTIYHTGSTPRIQVKQPTTQPSTQPTEVKPGVEISSNSKGLGGALTNPTELAKSKGNIKNSYPIYYQWLNKDGEAQDQNFKDVEEAYQTLKDSSESKTKPSIENSNNYKLMVDLLRTKLQQYPELSDLITKQGGSAWILSSTHQPTSNNTVWETGGKNWFIKALNDAYTSVKAAAPATETVTEDNGYKYYGAYYTVVLKDGVGVDVKGYKGKAAAKQKLLDNYNSNPNVDPQNGTYFRNQPPNAGAIIPLAPAETQPKKPGSYTYTFQNGFKVTTPFELNDEQRNALAGLEAFHKGTNKVVTISGAAGTGKSTIMSIFDKYLRNEYENVLYTSPTHRANAVTKMMNPNAKVYTLHTLFGLSPDVSLEDGNFDVKDLQFAEVNKPKIGSGDILVIDESSMVNDALYEFINIGIQQFNIKVIYVGDVAQLKPVKQNTKSKVFEEGQQTVHKLVKVERTGDNAVLEESVRIRNGLDWSYRTKLNDKGEGVVYLTTTKDTMKVVASKFSIQNNLDNKLFFRVLSATNKGVDNVNQAVREVLYPNDFSKQILEGEIIMGYSNFDRDYRTGQYKLYNGGDYQVTAVKPTTKKVPDLNLTFDGYEITIINLLDKSIQPYTLFVLDKSEKIEKVQEYADYIQDLQIRAGQNMKMGNKKEAAALYDKANKLKAEIATMVDYTKWDPKKQRYITILAKTFDYGYAHTIHKAQGGTYDNVLILADTVGSFPDEVAQQELKYVAVSRAKSVAYIRTSNPEATTQDNLNIDQLQMQREAEEIIKQKSNESKSCNQG
jgi:hypothetical protein